MKRILLLILCALTALSVLPLAPAAETAANVNNAPDYLFTEGMVYNILEKTTVDDFLSSCESIISASSKGEYIATGDILTHENGSEYRAVVFGDVDGNGLITETDYTLVKRYYLDNLRLEPIFIEAAKIGENISVYDYILIKRHVMKTYTIGSTPHRVLNGNGIKIAYIPLDNRPVNKDRVEYLAAASGFELLIPDEDLYRTALDNMAPNSDGSTLGNREKLLEWLKSVENECDYFVISLDQLISGGLVGSRYLSNTDLTFENQVADYLIQLAKSKHLILFDTVMRLASTVGYKGYDLDTYNALRSYGSKARKQLTGSELTVENIVAGYRYDANGKNISAGVSNTVLDQYLASRQRKLRIIDRLLTNAVEDIEHIYIGIDDSSPQVTIQTNEINYITSIGGENMTLFAGADELGLMGIAAVATDVYGAADCKVTYFGEGKDVAADGFDNSTLAVNIEKHFAAIGANMNSEKENALQVLVLTQSNNLNTNADKLMKTAVENVRAGIPTCIIDASNGGHVLPEKILNYDYDIAKLLGYSNWNTVGNTVGISLSNAVARYLYIYNSKEVTEQSNKAFLQSLTFSLIKDISYKRKGISNLSDTSAYGPATIIKRINSSDILVSGGKTASHGKVWVSNFRYPWNRTFEATFDITVN